MPKVLNQGYTLQGLIVVTSDPLRPKIRIPQIHGYYPSDNNYFSDEMLPVAAVSADSSNTGFEDGEIVYVTFPEGNYQNPLIIGRKSLTTSETTINGGRRYWGKYENTYDSYLSENLTVTKEDFYSPVYKATNVTSPYGGERKHSGVDLGINHQPVFAAADGIIVQVTDGYDENWHNEDERSLDSYGNYMTIYHGKNANGQHCFTRYAHLAWTLYEPGTKVTKDTGIAVSGNSGRSYGAHLHFEIRYSKSGSYKNTESDTVDPEQVITNITAGYKGRRDYDGTLGLGGGNGTLNYNEIRSRGSTISTRSIVGDYASSENQIETTTDNTNDQTMNNRMVECAQFFVNKKLNAAAICGILACIRKESRFNPNDNYEEDNGAISKGLFQMNGTRWKLVETYCAENNYDPRSIQGQLNAAWYELTEAFYTRPDRLKTLKSDLETLPNNVNGAMQAARSWDKNYESSKESEDRYGSWSRRVLAREYYKNFTTSNASSSTTSNNVADTAIGQYEE